MAQQTSTLQALLNDKENNVSSPVFLYFFCVQQTKYTAAVQAAWYYYDDFQIASQTLSSHALLLHHWYSSMATRSPQLYIACRAHRLCKLVMQ